MSAHVCKHTSVHSSACDEPVKEWQLHVCTHICACFPTLVDIHVSTHVYTHVYKGAEILSDCIQCVMQIWFTVTCPKTLIVTLGDVLESGNAKIASI